MAKVIAIEGRKQEMIDQIEDPRIRERILALLDMEHEVKLLPAGNSEAEPKNGLRH